MDPSQDIVGPNALLRLLRAPQDPPSSGGPTKIAIAASTWRNHASYIPHLAEILRDWMLSVWLDGTVSSASLALLDTAHHELMLSVLTTSRSPLPASALTRLFNVLLEHPSLTAVTQHDVWMLAREDNGSAPDDWFETWAAMLALLAHPTSASALSRELCCLVESALYRQLRGTSLNKRVVTATPTLVRNLAQDISLGASPDPLLTGSVFFPSAALRTGGSVDIVLQSWPSSPTTAGFVPHLLEAYRQSLWQHRYEIFIQPTSSRVPHETYINDKLRTSIRQAFDLCRSRLADLSKEAPIQFWRHTRACWELVARWSVYLSSDQTWAELLRMDAADGRKVMEREQDVSLLEVALGSLGVLESLDHSNAGLDTTVFAWCIAAPAQLFVEAAYVLSATLRYHQASRIEDEWINIVLDSLQSLARSSLHRDSVQAVHQLVSFGPLWEPNLLRSLQTTKHRDLICDQLRMRLQDLGSDQDVTTSIVVSAISRLADALSPIGTTKAEGLVTAAQHALGYGTVGQSKQIRDAANNVVSVDLGLASLLRLGRQASPPVQGRLEQQWELLDGIAITAENLELVRETVLWLLARLPQDPSQSARYLAALKQLASQLAGMRRSSTEAPSAGFMTSDDLAIVHDIASVEELQAVLGAILGVSAQAEHMLVSAELMDLKNFKTALLNHVLEMLSHGEQTHRAGRLILSLPEDQISHTMRARLVSHWLELDVAGDIGAKIQARTVMAHLAGPGSHEMLSRVWASLSSDLENHALRVSTAELMRRTTRFELSRGRIPESCSIRGRILIAEAAMEREFARYDAPIRQALVELSDALSGEIPRVDGAHAKWTVVEFSQWCGRPIHMSSMPSTSGSCPAQLRVVRALCSTDDDRLVYLNALLQSRDMLQVAAFQKEVQQLAREVNDYRLLLSRCMLLAQVVEVSEAAYTAVAQILAVRRQGSGKAIRSLRGVLTRCLFEPRCDGHLTEGQVACLRSLIKYRAKVLDVSDVARCLVVFAASRQTDLIDLVSSMASFRPDVIVHVLPQLVAFAQTHLVSITDCSVVPMTRLIKVLCGDRRRHRDARITVTNVNAMSKHAPAMLAAYVRGTANTDARISIEGRRALQSSIHQLCDLVVREAHRGREGEGIGQPYGVGEGNAAEQEVWADLWTSWSKQRYRGQG